MAQDLVPSKAQTITWREAEARIEAWHGRLEAHPVHPNRFCVRQDRAVSTIDRRLLSAVRERLERDLEPCRDREAVEAVVARLLRGLDHGRGLSPDDAADLRMEYVEAVADLPLIAVIEAASRFRCGKTLTPWKRGFRPFTGEFAEEARVGLVALRVKLVHVRRVLDAEVYDPPTEADRLKVATALEGLHRELRRRDAERSAGDGVAIAPDPSPEIQAGVAALRADLEARRLRREARTPVAIMEGTAA